jgi:aconitate decarboxylase
MVKRLHAGRAAQSGVYGAALASRGFTGITDLFESHYGGYCATFSPTYDLDRIVDGLGETWEVARVGFKPYSTNGSCHTTIDALLELRRTHGVTLDAVQSITVHASTATAKHVGWRYVPDSVTTAQMNLSYIAAVTLADGAAFVEQFTEDRIADPRLVAAANRVTVVADPVIDARGDAGRHNIRLEVTLTDGRVLRATRDYARGSARSPLSYREVADKFARLAGTVLPPDRVAPLHDLVTGLDQLDDVAQVTAALRR